MNNGNNMLPDGNENIQVHVRVRPLNEQELARGDQSCLHVAGDARTVHFVGQRDEVRSLTFDSVIGGSSQPQVFETTDAAQLLQDALEGYSVTIFAYGQTGSGKTYTMTGPDSLALSVDERPPLPTDESPLGLIPRGVGALFDLIAQEEAAGRLTGGCSVRASYLELYNESLNDLLNPESTNLQLRSHVKTGAFVENLLQVECESVADAMMVFAEGTRNRKVGSHALNKDSSRSHSLMTLHLTRRDAPHQGGRVCFVDLAGSERLLESHSKGEAAKETGHINKSLFALGNVISALADSRKRSGHIPYRDSKLTRLLQDSLGGDGRTLMLACCSPSSHHREETINTLAFASRAKNIQNRPVVAVGDAGGAGGGAALQQQMHHTIRALQEENALLRQRLVATPAAPLASAEVGGATARGSWRARLEEDEDEGTVGACLSASISTVAGAGAVAARHMAPAAAPTIDGRPRAGLAALRAVEGVTAAEPAPASADARVVAALKQEVAQLRTTNELLRRSHEQVVRENQQLQAKLERLENIFESDER